MKVGLRVITVFFHDQVRSAIVHGIFSGCLSLQLAFQQILPIRCESLSTLDLIKPRSSPEQCHSRVAESSARV